MSIDLIRYDRIWLQEYIEHISHEERLARELYSLAVTRHALEQYLEQVQEAAMHLRKKCLELEIPDFFE